MTHVNTHADVESKSRRAAHCMIYALTDREVLGGPATALVLMQLRFDGTIGFPGGLVEHHETYIEGVNREIHEEINVYTADGFVAESDFIMESEAGGKTVLNPLKLRFYAKRVSEERFIEIERDTVEAKHYGYETLGILRVPLFVNAQGGYGLPHFLRHHFVGNARQQLLVALEKTGVLDAEAIAHAVAMAGAAGGLQA